MRVYVNELQISAEAALQVVSAAREAANHQDLKVCISVCSASGAEVAFLKLDGAPALCTDIARDKAYTAACFGVSTEAWEQALGAEHERVLNGLRQVPRFTMFGGGIPITADGKTIGAIGVSGASEEQDVACAQAGARAVEANN